MIQVGVNGYGTIGKRVADAVVRQPDMELVGVAKTRPNHEAETAVEKGYPLYAAVEDRRPRFDEAGIEIAGGVEELVAASDVVVDACPSGIGAENKSMYEAHDTPALYQGGEDADLVDTSFNARSNFADAEGADHVRVVSCNTTGLSRLLAPLQEEYGVRKARVTLVRRGGDPSQSGRGPINDILPNPVTLPSHHGPDVNTIFPDLAIDTLGLKVPATLMHTHSVNVELEDAPTADEVTELLRGENRLFLIRPGYDIDGAGALKEFAMDRGRPRGDVWENAVWEESITVEDSVAPEGQRNGGGTSEEQSSSGRASGRGPRAEAAGADLYLFQAIHQESDVVPENVDAVRAVLGAADAAESMRRTDEALGLGF